MIILNVPYKQKDFARKLGARWDYELKCWYVPEGMLLTPFECWLDSTNCADAMLMPKETKNIRQMVTVGKSTGSAYVASDSEDVPWD